MAYYFAVETTKDNYLAINARKTGFCSTGKEKNPYQFTLEELDNYTTRFLDCNHFINFLLNQGIINGAQSEQKITIVHSVNAEKGCRTLPGNFIFKPYKMYLQEPMLVLEYILNKIEEQDYKFFEQLAAFIPIEKTSKQISNVFNDINNILLSNANLKRKKRQYKICLNNLKKLITTANKNNKRQPYFYENLHLIVSFISQHDIELTKNYETNKGKVRTRKPETGSNI